MPSAWLEIQDGPEAGKRIEIPPQSVELVLGRSPECEVVVAAPSVSRRHARLHRTADRFRLEDLGSANGTLVNGERVEGAVEVADQDRITLGSVQLLLVSPAPLPEPADDATLLAAPGGDATIAVAPRERVPEPAPRAPEPPPRPARPAPAAPPRATPAPVSEGTPTRPTPDAAATSAALTATRPAAPAPTPAPKEASEPPSPLELVAIGVASFLAVFGLGWLLL